MTHHLQTWRVPSTKKRPIGAAAWGRTRTTDISQDSACPAIAQWSCIVCRCRLEPDRQLLALNGRPAFEAPICPRSLARLHNHSAGRIRLQRQMRAQWVLVYASGGRGRDD